MSVVFPFFHDFQQHEESACVFLVHTHSKLMGTVYKYIYIWYVYYMHMYIYICIYITHYNPLFIGSITMPTLFQINSKLDHGAGKTDLSSPSELRGTRRGLESLVKSWSCLISEWCRWSAERWEQQNYLWLYIDAQNTCTRCDNTPNQYYFAHIM